MNEYAVTRGGNNWTDPEYAIPGPEIIVMLAHLKSYAGREKECLTVGRYDGQLDYFVDLSGQQIDHVIAWNSHATFNFPHK